MCTLRHASATAQRALAAVAVMAFGLATQAPAQITELGTLGGDVSGATKANNSGDVIGTSSVYTFESGSMPCYTGFLYRDGRMIPMTLGGGNQWYDYEVSQALDLNEAGDVIGWSLYEVEGVTWGSHAFLFRNGQMLDLGTLGGNYSGANDVNEAGDVVGWAQPPGSQTFRAFLYRNRIMNDLGTLGGTRSNAIAINEQGDVLGHSSTIDGQYHAFLYRNGHMTDLGTLGGDYSSAFAMNGRGDVIGYSSRTPGGSSFAFLYRNGQMIDLSALLGLDESSPVAINDAGDVIGQAWDSVNQAVVGFIYTRDGQMIELGLGGNRTYLQDLNEAGDVIGYSQDYLNGGHLFATFLWHNGQMFVLGSPTQDGQLSFAPLAIDNLGTVVGGALGTDGLYHAAFWQEGVVTVLDTNSSWYSMAAGITDSGVVFGGKSTPWGATAFITAVRPTGMLEALIDLIQKETLGGAIDPQVSGSLTAKVDAAIAALNRGDKNSATAAMNDLKALINYIEAQTNKKITPAAAADLIAHANAIIAELSR